jgi:radical SAM protein with 4Fe4S-binding SPASM domain
VAKPVKSSKKTSSHIGKDGLFALPKDFKNALSDCRTQAEQGAGKDVTYLWIAVSGKGVGRKDNDSCDVKTLSVEDWLNVVDESASLGANWVILTVTTRLSQFSEIWEICRWAQDTHGMMVGIHLGVDEVTAEDTQQMLSINLAKFRLLVRTESLEKLADLEKQGVVLWTANPQPDGVKPNCQGPARMIYVNAEGNLYTCGLVEGKSDYLMGSVLHDRLKHVVKSSSVRHCVEEDLHRVTSGCDGCPALIANYFSTNL